MENINIIDKNWKSLIKPTKLAITSTAISSIGLVHATSLDKTATIEAPYTYISGPGLTDSKVYYTLTDGIAYLEGDIILGTQAEVEAKRIAVESPSPSAIVTTNGTWQDGIVYYQFDASISTARRDDVYEAMRRWTDRVDVQFIERTNQADYVVISQPTKDCSAIVGRKGGPQYLKIASNCSISTIVHEFGHTLGLWHEQSRSDRDQYIEILWGNIDTNYTANFNLRPTDSADIGPYDYTSIMHYQTNAFSYNGQDTIRAIDSEGNELPNVIQPRYFPSEGDIAAIHHLYPNTVPAECTQAPAKPELPTYSHVIGQTALLKWNATEGATGYTGQVWDEPSRQWYDAGKTSNTDTYPTELVLFGLTEATEYARVIATNSCGSTASNWITIEMQSACTSAPTTPSGLYFTNRTTYGFTATWQPINNASTYNVQLWSGGAWQNKGSTSNSNFTFTNLTAGTQYYRVQASNNCGDSSWSNWISVQ